MIPRIIGKVLEGECDYPDKGKKEFYFQMWLTGLGEGEPNDSNSLGIFGPYDSHEIALDQLESACKLLAR